MDNNRSHPKLKSYGWLFYVIIWPFIHYIIALLDEVYIAFPKFYHMRAKKSCLNCNEIIIGRSDKKFCGDHCRSNYNYNKTGTDHMNLVRSVNRALSRNRRILKYLNKSGRTKVLKQSLTDIGFNFSYYTSILENDQRGRCYFCYDIGYLVLDERELLLLSKDQFSAK